MRKLAGILLFSLTLTVFSTSWAAGESNQDKKDTGGVRYVPMEPLIVNLEGRRRYLRAEIQMLVKDDTIAEQIKTHMPAIRHSLIMLFSGRNPDAITTIEERERLRRSAKDEVKKILAPYKADKGFDDLFFTDFIVQ